MANVRQPYFEVIYNQVDITADISRSITDITYSDSSGGEMNEIVVSVDDFDGKWKNEWLITIGATLQVKIGYSADEILDCGIFSIDEVTYKGEPSKVEIRGLSLSFDNSWRDKKSHIFNDSTIREIAQYVAEENGYKLAADNQIEGTLARGFGGLRALDSSERNRVLSIRLKKVVRDRETGIAFLNRIASKFGMSFVFYDVSRKVDTVPEIVEGTTIRRFAPQVDKIDKMLYLHVDYEFEQLSAITSAIWTEVVPEGFLELNSGVASEKIEVPLKSYSLKNSATNDIDQVEVVYHDPVNNSNEKVVVSKSDLPDKAQVSPLYAQFTFDRQPIKRTIYEYYENKQQAEIIAAAELYRTTSEQVTGSVDVEGAISLVAGTALQIENVGRLSGRYFVKKTTHKISRGSGYTTSADVKFLTPSESS